MQSYGNWVRENREMLGLTQENLAETIGVPTDTVVGIEIRNSVPSPEVIKKIGRLFKANPPVPEHVELRL
jgi:DNA-binding XRE family transcriptional regulator